MAANDYYTSFPPSSQHHDTAYYGSGAITPEYGRTNAPLPPVPATSSPRPYKPPLDSHLPQGGSPFDDRQYPAYPPPTQPEPGSGQHSPPYYGRPGDNASPYASNDPFADNNAIPLQNQGRDYGKNGGVGAALRPFETEQGPIRPDDRRYRRRRRKQGWFTGKITWACYTLFLIQAGVFVGEIVKNSVLTGSPIELHPSFNPMIGPSPYVLINMGARYVPCMKNVDAKITNNATNTVTYTPASSPDIPFQCPNTTTNDGNCHLQDLCGFGMDLTEKDGKTPMPNQWFRFITPIFLHAGIIHIGFNMLLQLTLGRDMELQIGTIRFVLIYFAAGIFGFVFGGNFAPNGIMSTGCSGSLFGIIALTLLDLLYSWKSRTSPVRELLFIGLDMVISFVLGLLPGLDNFSHIGGFLVGLTLGLSLLRSPDALRERIGLDDPKYGTLEQEEEQKQGQGLKTFAKQPVGFFKGRKPLWWAWWLIRAGALVLVVVVFIVLINNFYTQKDKCGWCKYLSCLPVKNWCDIGNLEITQYETANKFRRNLLVPDEL
ncbi:uncharacterized protein PV09_05363 [Verruconis gallopava]|uniref:Rhomboid-type serine protease n=1 Tax=Verruconis gallopava TaxID=253628 RepID=A0A0D2AAL1_9PEZI|nr:uncharacterized protein PV09_05363 [Verruconis gallopava]KIW03610.1 hypothetical protein PV09_05363 [Verruconis gallopava]